MRERGISLHSVARLAPGGIGVGHMAFKHLYMLVGWTGGADVFNIMVMGSLVLNLLGVVPYLFYRTKMPVETDLDAVEGPSAPTTNV